MTEAVICGSAHRNEGATEPECDALTVDAERRAMRGWGEGGVCAGMLLSF